MALGIYRYWLDVDRDGTFSNPASEITTYVISTNFSWGLTDAYQEFANPAAMQMTLDNSTRIFNPSREDSVYYNGINKGTMVRIRAEFNGEFFEADYKVTAIQLTAGASSYNAETQNMNITLAGTDAMWRLLDAEFKPMFQEDVRVDEAMQTVFDRAVIAYPYEGMYATLDLSTLNDCSLLDSSITTDFEEARQTLTEVGDNSDTGMGISAQGFLRELLLAEAGGRFWFNPPTNKFTFHNRWHDTQNFIPVFEMNTGMCLRDSMTLLYGDDLINDVTINYSPRQYGVANSTIWESDQVPIRLFPEEVVTITGRYRNPDNEAERIGATDVHPPLAGTDYDAWNAVELELVNLLADLQLSFVDNASSGDITMTNRGQDVMWVHMLKVRGTPIYIHNPETVQRTDLESINQHDRHATVRDIKLMTDVNDAEGYANLIIKRFKTPRTRFPSVTFIANQTDELMTQAITHTLRAAKTIHSRLFQALSLPCSLPSLYPRSKRSSP